jgi:homoserine dehydrogenase
VLSKIATILSDSGISIEAMIQKEAKEGESNVPLILLTNIVQEKKLASAIRSIESLDSISGKVQRIRVESLK